MDIDVLSTNPDNTLHVILLANLQMVTIELEAPQVGSELFTRLVQPGHR